MMQMIEWEKTRIEELDIKGTELSQETLVFILTRLQHLRWLDVSLLENMTDQVGIYEWIDELSNIFHRYSLLSSLE